MHPNRAGVTPIGQQNAPGPLKLSVLHKKTSKNTDFYFAQITIKILVYVFTPSCAIGACLHFVRPHRDACMQWHGYTTRNRSAPERVRLGKFTTPLK